jgi:hypothetical protein
MVAFMGATHKRRVFFFFEQGRVPKDPDTALNLSGGVTEYIEGLQENENYNQAPTLCKQDPTTKHKNAIRSFTTTLASSPPVAASNLIAGDGTTWDENTEECHASRG